MTDLKKVFFTTKQFNNLIGGGSDTLKDLYNYNHLKPEKIAAAENEKIENQIQDSNKIINTFNLYNLSDFIKYKEL